LSGVRSDEVLNISRAVTQTAKELLPAVRAVISVGTLEDAIELAGV
jgi:hypothetical protein